MHTKKEREDCSGPHHWILSVHIYSLRRKPDSVIGHFQLVFTLKRYGKYLLLYSFSHVYRQFYSTTDSPSKEGFSRVLSQVTEDEFKEGIVISFKNFSIHDV